MDWDFNRAFKCYGCGAVLDTAEEAEEHAQLHEEEL